MAESVYNIIQKCAKQFRFYETNHRAKEPPDTAKADANADYALMCEAALQSIPENWDRKREDKYGVALLMIANGCDDAQDFATKVLRDNGVKI